MDRLNKPLTIEEGPMDPELGRMFEPAERNLDWFNEHAMELMLTGCRNSPEDAPRGKR